MIIPSRRNSINSSDERSVPFSSSVDDAMEIVTQTHLPPWLTAKSGKTNHVNTTSTWIKGNILTESLSPNFGSDVDHMSTTNDSLVIESIDILEEVKLESAATTAGGMRSNSIVIFETCDDNEEDMLSRLLLDDAQDAK